MTKQTNPSPLATRIQTLSQALGAAAFILLGVLSSGCLSVGNTTLSPKGAFHADAAWTAIWPSSTRLQPGSSIRVEPVTDTVYEAYADRRIVIPVRITLLAPSSVTNRDFWAYSTYSIYHQPDQASPLQQPPMPLAVAVSWPKPDGTTPQVLGGGLWERRVVTFPPGTNTIVANIELQYQHTPAVTISGGLVELGSCFVYLTDHCKHRPVSILSNILTVRFLHWK